MTFSTNYLPKTPCTIIITLKVRTSAYEFAGDTNIQSITVTKLRV